MIDAFFIVVLKPDLTTAKYIVLGAVIVVVSGVNSVVVIAIVIVVGGSIVFPVVVIAVVVAVVGVLCDFSSVRLCSTKLLSSVMLTRMESKIGLYLAMVALFSSIA